MPPLPRIRQITDIILQITCICYALIIIYVRKTQFRGDQGGEKPSANQRNRNRIVIMCAALVVVFAICWVPYHAQHLAKMNGIVGKSVRNYFYFPIRIEQVVNSTPLLCDYRLVHRFINATEIYKSWPICYVGRKS